MKKILLILLIGIFLIVGTTALISKTSLETKISQDIERDLNIKADVSIIENWNIEYLSYEKDVKSNITILNSTTLEINITNYGGGGYKWMSAICNYSGVDAIEKFEYNPATNVWTSTGNLNYGKLINYGMNSTWCSENNGYGYVLFASTSKNKLFRLKFQEGYKKLKIITGSGSEIILLEFSGIKEENGIVIAKFKSNIPNYTDKQITLITTKK